MKTKVKIFRWNEVKNKTDIKIGVFDNSRKITSKDVEIKRMLKEKLAKELTK